MSCGQFSFSLPLRIQLKRFRSGSTMPPGFQGKLVNPNQICNADNLLTRQRSSRTISQPFQPSIPLTSSADIVPKHYHGSHITPAPTHCHHKYPQPDPFHPRFSKISWVVRSAGEIIIRQGLFPSKLGFKSSKSVGFFSGFLTIAWIPQEICTRYDVGPREGRQGVGEGRREAAPQGPPG